MHVNFHRTTALIKPLHYLRSATAKQLSIFSGHVKIGRAKLLDYGTIQATNPSREQSSSQQISILKAIFQADQG